LTYAQIFTNGSCSFHDEGSYEDYDGFVITSLVGKNLDQQILWHKQFITFQTSFFKRQELYSIPPKTKNSNQHQAKSEQRRTKETEKDNYRNQTSRNNFSCMVLFHPSTKTSTTTEFTITITTTSTTQKPIQQQHPTKWRQKIPHFIVRKLQHNMQYPINLMMH
jgi:hypothetical protein